MLCLKLPCAQPAWSLGLMFVAVLLMPGCGPAVPDHTSSPSSRASLSAQSELKSTVQNTLTKSPVPFAASFGSNDTAALAVEEEPAPLPEYLALPTWIAQALDAPEVSVRLGALDKWAQQGSQASLDPLVVALDDENDDVRRKAMAIIEQHWTIEQGEETAAKK